MLYYPGSINISISDLAKLMGNVNNSKYWMQEDTSPIEIGRLILFTDRNVRGT